MSKKEDKKIEEPKFKNYLVQAPVTITFALACEEKNKKEMARHWLNCLGTICKGRLQLIGEPIIEENKSS